jgi:hypothetical protein
LEGDAMIEDVRQAALYTWVGDFVTPLGRKWRSRIEAAEAYHNENSKDWSYLRDLFVNMQARKSATWSPTVAMAYSIITAAASDTYFNNPESWIQAKSGDPDGDISRAFRDIANTAHRDADTEGIMRKCLVCDGFAGFGVHWAYFEQVEDAPPVAAPPPPLGTPNSELGTPTPTDAAQPPQSENGPGNVPNSGLLSQPPKVVSQKVCGDFCEPWDWRCDPDGRDWKLTDHKYIIRKYRKTIAELIEMPFASENGKAMLYTWGKSRRQSKEHQSDSKWGSDSGSIDNDIGYMPVDMWEIWDRVSKTIIHIPVGADFDLGSLPWPRAWRYANAFPATFVAFNWEPGDKDRKRGFYPIPLLRLIRDQLENLNDLEGLWMEAATSDVIKFLTVKGLLDDSEITNLTNNQSRIVVSVDIMKIKEFFPTAVNNLGELDLRKIIHQLEASDKSASFEYEKAIEHELRQIGRIVSSGPQDRFGLPEARSATEAAGLIDAMGKRGRTKSELAANKYDEITEKFFLIFKTMQTLPIEYRASTPDFSEGVWRQWSDLASVRTLSLAFDHRTGTSTARDPESEKAARNAFGQMVLPIYAQAQQFEKVDDIVKWMAEAQNFRNLNIFQSQSKSIAMELAYMTALLKVNPMLAADPDFADKKADLSSQLALSLLSPTDQQAVAAKVNQAVSSGEAMQPGGGQGGGGQQQGQGPSPGSLPSQQTPGQAAFGGAAMGGANVPSAAAGMTGGA